MALKKKIVALLSFVFMFALVLFGCNSIHLSGGPDSTDTVYGNGGSAVVKGDYLYFANAFVDYTALGHNDNVYDAGSKYTPYGIYRTKLNVDGTVPLDSEGVPVKADLLTYNIGGYEYAGLYIFGNYLYYTTPFTNITNSDETKTGRVRVERVALDGTSHEIVYKFDDYTSDCEYDMVYIDGNVFIIYKTSDKDIKLISIDTRKSRKETTVATSVESYAIFEQKNIESDNVVADINKFVYYVVKEDNDYVIYRTNLLTKTKEEFYRSSSELVLKEVKNNKVYYTEDGYIYSRIDKNTFKKYSDISTSSNDISSISSYLVVDLTGSLDKGIIGVNKSNSNYYVTYFNGNVARPLDLAEDTTKSITLVAYINDCIFYQISGDEALYKREVNFVIENGKYDVTGVGEAKVIATSFSATINEKTILDFDNERIYIYETLDNNQYLTMYMIDENLSYLDGEKVVGQYIGNK